MNYRVLTQDNRLLAVECINPMKDGKITGMFQGDNISVATLGQYRSGQEAIEVIRAMAGHYRREPNVLFIMPKAEGGTE